ncbi:MAG: long-chain fatty acid--CoA ligase [Nitrosomonas sp.]|nr:long-chain fatty acid--CoA ligase [Nitrosomonas sp.]MDP1951281.1 long-chain fatty acid--CoA ligase [Nitrosomonas sp.]
MTSIISVEQAKTLDGLFGERVIRSPQNIAYRYFDQLNEQWCDHTWTQMGQAVARWQVALSKETLVPGDRVAVMLRNCPEWVMFEQAALGLGLVIVPFYTEDRADNVAYMLSDAGVKLLLLEKTAQWQEVCDACHQIVGLQRVVIVNTLDQNNNYSCAESLLVSHNDWLPAETKEHQIDSVQHVSSDPQRLATIIYTSGTTGRPKGVMLSHYNILTNAHSCLQIVPVLQEDLLLSFLPLSHTFERTVGYYIPMMCGALIAYARSTQQLQEDLLTIRPTILVSVPRIYERVYAGIRAKLAQGSELSRQLFNFAVDVGYSRFEHQQGRGPWKLSHLLWPLLDKLVANKLMNRLGGRLRQAMSGGAPLSAEMSRVFIGLGLPILQGFGMTETSPVVCTNRLEDNVPTSVGRPIPKVEIKLGENNALLIRGPNVMLGYWNNPEATKAAISADGWLNSGDVAAVDAQDHVIITGRIKEIIVMSTGEKIPPADIEAAILRDSLFEQVILVGEGRSYLSVLVVLDPKKWQSVCAQHQLDADLHNPAQRQQIEELLLPRITHQIHDFPGYAKIYRVALIPEPWTVENEMLTPTLKLRRVKIMEHYKSEVERLYEGH